MKQVVIDSYGAPWDVARCAEVADVGAPAADEVVFDVLAFPINPADMWFCKGSYRLKPPLPATPGAECVGRITAVGASVRHVKPGDLVINLQRENWAQQRKVKGDDAIPLPAGIDLKQVLDEATRRKLNEAVVENIALVIRDQQLTPQQYLDGMRNFGDIIIDSGTKKETAKASGVLNEKGMASRWTYYIGKDGKIAHIEKEVKTKEHASQISAKLKDLGVEAKK